MKIAIIFVGLIVQVNQPMSFDNTAVLIEAPEHLARLIIPLQSVIDPDEWLKQQPVKGPNVEIDLKGATVRVQGTRGVFSDLKKEFKTASLGLGTVAPGCKLRAEVRNRQIVCGELSAYVDFRGGEVVPDSYLPRKLSFTGDAKDGQCTVCRSRYEASLRGDSATLVFKKRVPKSDGSVVEETHEIRIAGRQPRDRRGIPEIVVSNKPPTPMPHHFASTFNIYSGECALTPLHPIVAEKCDEAKICLLTSIPLDPEHGPGMPADPGDDCTIVRHP